MEEEQYIQELLELKTENNKLIRNIVITCNAFILIFVCKNNHPYLTTYF